MNYGVLSVNDCYNHRSTNKIRTHCQLYHCILPCSVPLNHQSSTHTVYSLRLASSTYNRSGINCYLLQEFRDSGSSCSLGSDVAMVPWCFVNILASGPFGAVSPSVLESVRENYDLLSFCGWTKRTFRFYGIWRVYFGTIPVKNYQFNAGF